MLGAFGVSWIAGGALAQARPAPAPPSSVEGRLAALADETRLPLSYDGRRFSGWGWDHLVREGRAAQAVLMGEDHGVAEIPALAGQLFEALRPAGFEHVGIEISPPLAREVERVLDRGGVPALRAWFQRTRGVAFYTLAEEAAFLARVRAAAPSTRPVFFGLDYEVGGDGFMVARLGEIAPAAARAPLERLARASAEGWAEFDRTRDPSRAFSFSGDPELVRAVRRSWPSPRAEAAELLATLEETLEINRLQATGLRWAARERRAAFNRAAFVRWRAAETRGGVAPKALLKFGADHMMRGQNTSGNFDVGSLAAEAAALERGRSLHLLVVPVSGEQAVFDPSAWRYRTSKVEMVLPQLVGRATGHAVLDLRPLRPLAAERAAPPRLAQFIHGYDAAVFLADTKASTNLT